ncbi:MAG: hypothetical protein KAW09_03560 [Thermoplasmata archaeon]|nr:hypothetical protein [Thermoplasmata archaeon]
MTDEQSKTGMRVLILGLIVLVVGIVIAAIPVTERQCVTFVLEVCTNVTTFPYAPYGAVLFFVGLAMVIGGAIMAGIGSGSKTAAQPTPQQQYYAQPYQAQQAPPAQYAPQPAQPYPQQQPAPIGTCGYCGRPFYYGETVCQGCRYAIPRTQ